MGFTLLAGEFSLRQVIDRNLTFIDSIHSVLTFRVDREESCRWREMLRDELQVDMQTQSAPSSSSSEGTRKHLYFGFRRGLAPPRGELRGFGRYTPVFPTPSNVTNAYLKNESF